MLQLNCITSVRMTYLNVAYKVTRLTHVHAAAHGRAWLRETIIYYIDLNTIGSVYRASTSSCK